MVTLDEAAWRQQVAALEAAGSRVARLVGDPADEVVMAAAAEMARELFGELLGEENAPET